VLEARCPQAAGWGEAACARVIQVRARKTVTSDEAPGDEHFAVAQQGRRVTPAHYPHAAGCGELACARVIQLRAVIAVAPRDEHFAIAQQGRRVIDTPCLQAARRSEVVGGACAVWQRSGQHQHGNQGAHQAARRVRSVGAASWCGSAACENIHRCIPVAKRPDRNQGVVLPDPCVPQGSDATRFDCDRW